MENETSEKGTPTAEDLEREKLLLEIAELKKRWWKKPTYIAALFPTLLALITLTYGFANGYFQASFVKLENQKHDLQAEKDKLEVDIKQTSEATAILEQRKKNLQADITEAEQLLADKPDRQGAKHAHKGQAKSKSVQAKLDKLAILKIKAAAANIQRRFALPAPPHK
jgi:hypothetical protein